jgi:asparagine synthase (glutamine-hydrolysing)
MFIIDVPFGMFLSRDLDCSLVATVTSRHFNNTKAANVWGAQLHTFFVNFKVMIDFD